MGNALLERIMAKTITDPQTGCVEWQRAHGNGGYGIVRIDGKNVRVTRLLWELVNGPIPKGMMVLHKCDNPRCVNLDHLFLGTQQDNMADCSRKGRIAYGSRHGRSKLTEEDVSFIREHAGELDNETLAKQFDVSALHVWKIVTRRTWKHMHG